MRRIGVVVVLMLLLAMLAEVADAQGPFRRWVRCGRSSCLRASGGAASCQSGPTPPAAFKEAGQAVREPSSPVGTVGSVDGPGTFSVQGTVGEPRQDGGLPSLIGVLRSGGKLKIELPEIPPIRLDPSSLSNVSMPPVSISVPGLEKSTAESLQSLAPRLHTLLTLLQASLVIFVGGTSAQWVTKAASGLGVFMQALSRVREVQSGQGSK